MNGHVEVIDLTGSGDDEEVVIIADPSSENKKRPHEGKQGATSCEAEPETKKHKKSTVWPATGNDSSNQHIEKSSIDRILAGPSPKGLDLPVAKRLKKELAKFVAKPPEGMKVEVEMLDKWIIHLNMPNGTVYQGEQYRLQFRFLKGFPFEAPEVIFLRPAPLHPHVYRYTSFVLCFLRFPDQRLL